MKMVKLPLSQSIPVMVVDFSIVGGNPGEMWKVYKQIKE